jgi:two-component system, LytTR family, sensor histidine kinase AlgZ
VNTEPQDPVPATARSSYLPDFCEPHAVLVMVLVATLVALVLALARHSVSGELWTELARTSAYLLWTTLLCAALLCRTRSWLARQTLRNSTLAALGIIVGVVTLISECIYWLGRSWDAQLGAPSGLFPTEHMAFLLPNVAIGAIVGGLALRYFYVSNEWRRSVEIEARARFRALQARIRPHFLFNSMNTIAALTRSDPVRAEAAIEDLSDLFRVALAESRPEISLQEEIEIARIYQRIEELRLGSRLQVHWDVDSLPPDALVPGLLLQPLLENAIGHGIEPLPQGGVVTIVGRAADGMISLEVGNPVSAQARSTRPGNRMALDNIRQRLELVFRGQASVTVDDPGDAYHVTLRFPVVHEPTSADDAVGLAADPLDDQSMRNRAN